LYYPNETKRIELKLQLPFPDEINERNATEGNNRMGAESERGRAVGIHTTVEVRCQTASVPVQLSLLLTLPLV